MNFFRIYYIFLYYSNLTNTESVVRSISLTRTLSGDPADTQALESEDVQSFLNSFYKIKPGEDLIEKTGFSLLDKDLVSKPLSVV